MNNKNLSGGYNNYSLRSSTLVENYVPGPGRTNILTDPDASMGKFTPSAFSNPYYNGPGTLNQALPDASRYQTERIFANPSGNTNRNFSIDNRQIETYLVEQLTINPLSQYTSNPNGELPMFNCTSTPDDYLVNKRKEDFKSYFETGGGYLIDPASQEVVDWASKPSTKPKSPKRKINPNSSIVYNLNMGSMDNFNPMIAQESSNVCIQPSSNCNNRMNN